MAYQPVLPPNKIAFVLDGVVQDVLHTDDRLAAILLSNPTIVDATKQYVNQVDGFNVVQWGYKDGEFIPAETPVVIQPTPEV